MDVLIHISQQLSNSTTPAFVPIAFQVSSNASAVNTLFFLSLTFVLIDAFLAMLVKGWLQEFDRGWRKYTIAHLRAQERERRLQELERWKLHELVSLLPILIQGSLLLFCIGLIMLIFPLHLPSAILCSFILVVVIGFYGFTTYVSIVNHYAPFSSPVSRLLARGLATVQTWHFAITRSARRIASAAQLYKLPLPPREQKAFVDGSHETMQSLPSNTGVAEPTQPHQPDDVETSKLVPRSRSGIEPQTHVHVLERLVSTTAEAVENIPIFLELLDQPVRNIIIRPSNTEKWKELLHLTFGLLRDQSTFPVSAAWTLARAMMFCYNSKTVDRQLCLTMQQHIGSQSTDDQRPRVPLNVLFSPYLRLWLGSPYPVPHGLWRKIAFLEPSDAADAELFWMVNTFHKVMHFDDLSFNYYHFFFAVLTYVSSTEQSRRSKIPLTAAVIYALCTIRSALGQGGIGSVDGLFILPGTVSTSEPVPMTFCPVTEIDALDLWSEDCIRMVKDLLQWELGLFSKGDFQLVLIAALYIDSIKQTHARSVFADLLSHTKIAHIESENADAYDHGKLVLYRYMALTQKPLDQDRDPIAALYGVIEHLITEHSTLQIPGLHLLEIAVKHVHKTIARSPDWLHRWSSSGSITISLPTELNPSIKHLNNVDHWILLHLETLLAPQSYLLPEEVKGLKWSGTPVQSYIAFARFDFYDSLAKSEYEGTRRPKPDPDLLRVFLWSGDMYICKRAFEWCMELAPISQSGPPGDGDSTGMFISETMGYDWIEYFLHELCDGDSYHRIVSWAFLDSHLVPKWTTLPSSWRRDFASAFLFSIVQPLKTPALPIGVPVYQHLSREVRPRPKFLLFLETVLQSAESNLTSGRITSLEYWLAEFSERFECPDARASMENILVTRRQLLEEETVGLFAELPLAYLWTDG